MDSGFGPTSRIDLGGCDLLNDVGIGRNRVGDGGNGEGNSDTGGGRVRLLRRAAADKNRFARGGLLRERRVEPVLRGPEAGSEYDRRDPREDLTINLPEGLMHEWYCCVFFSIKVSLRFRSSLPHISVASSRQLSNVLVNYCRLTIV